MSVQTHTLISQSVAYGFGDLALLAQHGNTVSITRFLSLQDDLAVVQRHGKAIIAALSALPLEDGLSVAAAMLVGLDDDAPEAKFWGDVWATVYVSASQR